MKTQPIYYWLARYNDLKALSKGPKAYGKRVIRRESHKALAKLLRRTVG